ncbi:MAG TPA: hypothetical protein PKK59_11245 [Anaerolineaceae bacterium]|nr:hypothetical protein [Anaerolineaceae bacterium]
MTDRLKTIFLTLLTILVLLTPSLARAETDPWTEVFLPDGSLNPNLIDLGVTTDTPDWMTINLPFEQTLALTADYHRFQTESGNIVILPSTQTLFFMAMNPVESGLASSDGLVGNGVGGLAAFLGLAAGSYLDWEQVQADHPEYSQPDQFWNAVLAGDQNAWTYFSGWSFITNLLQISWQDDALRSMYLLYLNGAAACAALPGGCSGVAANPPPAPQCPDSKVALQRPDLRIYKTAPTYPLVIGQDKEAQRGADIKATVTIPPVLFTWYEPVYEWRTFCRPAESGEEPNCSTGSEADEEDGIAYARRVFTGCRVHVERLPESVVSLKASAVLDAGSRAWITGGLAQTHYEAYLRNPSLTLIPAYGTWSGGCTGNGTCSAAGEALGVPFEDPGTYALRLEVVTSGTRFRGVQITQPRQLGGEGAFVVYVTLPAIVE